MKIKLLILTLLFSVFGWGQTNPTAQTLPYTQNFSSLTGVGPLYPAGWQGWNVTGTINTAYVTTAPNADQAISVQTNATAPGALIGDFIGKIGVMSSANATTGQKTICLSINTTLLSSIAVSFNAATQRTENTRQNALGLQYRLGTSGVFTNVSSSEYLNQLLPTNITGTASVNVQNIAVTLPSACDNQAVVQLRWVTRDVSGAGNRPGFSIDDISVSGTPASSNTITTNTTLVGSPFCVSGSTGATVSVPFTSVGTFNAGNVYTAQLSNAAGSFASPVSIGTVTSTLNTDVILATIPAGTAAGTGYRIRVISNNPVVTGSDNTVNLTVRNAIAITAQPPNQVITDGSNTTFTVTATGTTPTYQWQVDTGSGFNDLSNGAPYSNVTTATLNITAAPIAMNGYLYRCVVSGAAPCGSVTSNSGSLTVTLTPPNNPTTIVPCYGNNTLGLSWTASSGGSAPDGYMVFALAGATTPAATAVAAGNSSLYTANSDFSLASIVTASLGKCLYKGTGTSFAVTGLTNLSNYSFKVVAYRGTTGTAWSSGINTTGTWNTPTTNITIDIPEVTALAASIASSQSALTWTRPTPLVCYDEYLVVANQGAVVFTPSGDGTAYTPNSVYSAANQVVYKGTGAGTTVTGLTNGLSYCYKVFVRRGTEWSDGVSVCQIPNLVYCASGATSNLDSEIENVTLVGYSTTISNNTTNVCTTGVNDYTAMSADLQVGGAYTVAVEFGDCSGGSQFDGAGGVWIDWNNDGDFLDANETIGTTDIAMTATDANVIQNFIINVPGGQPIGNYRMRIVQTEAGTSATVSPCGTFTYGSTEDYTVQVIVACVPTHTVTSFTPTSGPVGTEVTINGTGLTGATVTFSGINATIVSNTGTQIVAVIPAGATTGMLSVKDSQPCAVDNTYTIIADDNTSCEGSSTTTDLIIYELHDEQSGDGGFITLYNGTAATVNLANYSIYRTGDYGGVMANYATLTGTIAPGALGVVTVDAASCGATATNGDINAGFNENDGIQLRNAAGTIVIDDVHAYTVGPGFYMVRNTGALSARTSYVAADWSTTPLAAGDCVLSAGLTPPSGGVSPAVTTHPSYTPSCGATSATLTAAGTEGFIGGNALAYQWYFVAPGNATWTAVTDGGIYSGATTASLSISVITGVINYQYYCQIRENTATCYSASNAIKITDTNATTWNGTVWSNGMPTLSKAATINGNYTTATNGSFSACNLTINATFTLTVSGNNYVEIQNNITNNGTFNIQNNGSLVQINDLGVNTGNISYERIASVKQQDYVYWSSPVNGFDVNSISPLTPAYYHWFWNPTVANTNGGLGNWQNASTTMTAGQGYIVRAPNGFSNAANQNWTATFNNGVPRNGVFTPAIARGSYTGANYAGTNGVTITSNDDNWNLLGNPYPSAISINSFLTANPQLDGFVRLWTHGTLPVSAVNPFYASFVYNYTVADYVAINGSGATSGPGVLSVIGGGQGFFTLMLPGVATTTTATFNNAMRNRTYSNSQFYRTANHIVEPTQELGGNIERNRIWIDLVSPTAETTRTLVAYVEGATLEKDRMFDALTDYKSAQNFYSLIGDEVMTIQGRSLPFDINDRVPMGIKIPTNGTYTIAIATVDGLFTGNAQKIYIEDKLLGTINDISEIPYQFTATQGITNDRFVLRYTNQALSNADFDLNENTITVFASSNEIKINSSLETIKDYTVYNVLGQTLATKNNVNTNQSAVSSIMKNNQALIVKVTLENGQTVIKKIIF